MLVRALVGGLLNAAGIRKTANGQPVGIRRDVARFFAEPLYDVSHALQIDQLRRGLQAVTGRSGDDDINASLPDPTTTDRPGRPHHVATTLPPKKQAFSPDRPHDRCGSAATRCRSPRASRSSTSRRAPR